MTMEDVNKTVTTALGATPAHATLDMLAVASMDVWVCSLVSSGISLALRQSRQLPPCKKDVLFNCTVGLYCN